MNSFLDGGIFNYCFNSLNFVLFYLYFGDLLLFFNIYDYINFLFMLLYINIIFN